MIKISHHLNIKQEGSEGFLDIIDSDDQNATEETTNEEAIFEGGIDTDETEESTENSITLNDEETTLEGAKKATTTNEETKHEVTTIEENKDDETTTIIDNDEATSLEGIENDIETNEETTSEEKTTKKDETTTTISKETTETDDEATTLEGTRNYTTANDETPDEKSTTKKYETTSQIYKEPPRNEHSYSKAKIKSPSGYTRHPSKYKQGPLKYSSHPKKYSTSREKRIRNIINIVHPERKESEIEPVNHKSYTVNRYNRKTGKYDKVEIGYEKSRKYSRGKGDESTRKPKSYNKRPIPYA